MNNIISLIIEKELIKQLNINKIKFNIIINDFKFKLVNNLIVIIYGGNYFIFKQNSNNKESLILSKLGENPYISVNTIKFSGIEFLAFSTSSQLELITLSQNITNTFTLAFNEALDLTKVWELTHGLVLEFGSGSYFKFIRDPFKGVEQIEISEIKGIAWSSWKFSYFVKLDTKGYKLYSYELMNVNCNFDSNKNGGGDVPLKVQKQIKSDSVRDFNGPFNIKLELELPVKR
jgi:hypothetical protein